MSNPQKEIDFAASMLRIAMENNALLKTILHYQEKAESARTGMSLEEIENSTDEILSENMDQAADLLIEQE